MSAVVTTSRAEYCGFLEKVSSASERVLLLDYDGTLAPFTADRDSAFPYPPIPRLLEMLIAGYRTRVALVTSRPAREAARLLGVDPHPEVFGMYGLEHLLPNGVYEIGHISQEAGKALETAAAWSRKEGLESFAENKPGAFALHWRGLPSERAEVIRSYGYQALAPLACHGNLLLNEFDGGLELRVRACNKGHAVRSILADTSPEVPVAYLGDDLADEDAFRALSGRGLTVLVRASFRHTAAELWLRPPDDLVQFLTDWVCACGGVA